MRRGDSAARHQLDLTRPLPQLLSGAQPNLIWTVGDGSDPLLFGVTQRTTHPARKFKVEAKIAVA
jgi:hypothetical protein